MKMFSDSLGQGDMWRHGSGNLRSTLEEWQVHPGLHTSDTGAPYSGLSAEC